MTRSPSARSPSARRSQILSSPDRGLLSRFLSEDRNNEVSHRDALAAAQIEHERVREAAIRVFNLHELEAERKRIEDLEKKEQERLAAEAALVQEELRLRELRKKSIPKPPPEPPSPKQEPPPPVKAPAAEPQPPAPQPAKEPEKSVPTSRPVLQQAPTPPQPIKAPAEKPAVQQTVPTLTNGATQSITTAVKPAVSASDPTAPSSLRQKQLGRYKEIHGALKKLRTDIVAASKVPGSPLKGPLGNMRREIRTAIGQLTGVQGANRPAVAKIITHLKEALEGKVPSPPVDVSLYVLDNREPVDGAMHNGPTMPALFIYLMNICAKAIISQFVNECAANPKAADPIGVSTAQIFSAPEFHWRGKSLIDILMAKFRVACPVLFGVTKGNEKTHGGRANLGWRKIDDSYVTEQVHNDRMTGLGAGFAAISLRDFSKVKKTNPFPPVNYWKAIAFIINTPAGETTNTHYVVLRSMIQSYEQRFLNFFGRAALAALQLALVEFPKKAPANASAAGSLAALAEVLRNNGLVLA